MCTRIAYHEDAKNIKPKLVIMWYIDFFDLSLFWKHFTIFVNSSNTSAIS